MSESAYELKLDCSGVEPDTIDIFIKNAEGETISTQNFMFNEKKYAYRRWESTKLTETGYLIGFEVKKIIDSLKRLAIQESHISIRIVFMYLEAGMDGGEKIHMEVCVNNYKEESAE